MTDATEETSTTGEADDELVRRLGLAALTGAGLSVGALAVVFACAPQATAFESRLSAIGVSTASGASVPATATPARGTSETPSAAAGKPTGPPKGLCVAAAKKVTPIPVAHTHKHRTRGGSGGSGNPDVITEAQRIANIKALKAARRKAIEERLKSWR